MLCTCSLHRNNHHCSSSRSLLFNCAVLHAFPCYAPSPFSFLLVTPLHDDSALLLPRQQTSSNCTPRCKHARQAAPHSTPLACPTATTPLTALQHAHTQAQALSPNSTTTHTQHEQKYRKNIVGASKQKHTEERWGGSRCVVHCCVSHLRHARTPTT